MNNGNEKLLLDIINDLKIENKLINKKELVLKLLDNRHVIKYLKEKNISELKIEIEERIKIEEEKLDFYNKGKEDTILKYENIQTIKNNYFNTIKYVKTLLPNPNSLKNVNDKSVRSILYATIVPFFDYKKENTKKVLSNFEKMLNVRNKEKIIDIFNRIVMIENKYQNEMTKDIKDIKENVYNEVKEELKKIDNQLSLIIFDDFKNRKTKSIFNILNKEIKMKEKIQNFDLSFGLQNKISHTNSRRLKIESNFNKLGYNNSFLYVYKNYEGFDLDFLNKFEKKIKIDYEKIKNKNTELKKEEENILKIIEKMKRKAEDFSDNPDTKYIQKQLLKEDFQRLTKTNYELLNKKNNIFKDKPGEILLDISKLKAINDNYGENVGDLYLTAFSSALFKSMTGFLNMDYLKINEIIKGFKHGGDEYSLILDDLSEYLNNKKSAKNIVEVFQNKIKIKDGDNEKIYFSDLIKREFRQLLAASDNNQLRSMSIEQIDTTFAVSTEEELMYYPVSISALQTKKLKEHKDEVSTGRTSINDKNFNLNWFQLSNSENELLRNYIVQNKIIETNLDSDGDIIIKKDIEMNKSLIKFLSFKSSNIKNGISDIEIYIKEVYNRVNNKSKYLMGLLKIYLSKDLEDINVSNVEERKRLENKKILGILEEKYNIKIKNSIEDLKIVDFVKVLKKINVRKNIKNQHL